MAGINLSGAIGMTGKRESVLSDVAPIIQHTGDAIAKQMAESKAKRERESLLKAQKDSKAQEDMSDDFSNFISGQYKDLSPEYSSTFHDYAVPETNNVMKIITNPAISNSKKQQALEEAKYNIQMAHNHYKEGEKAYGELDKMKKEGIYDTSEAEKFLAGVGENVQENIPNTLDRTINPVSTPNDSKVVETNVRQPFHQLSYEERKNIAPQGINNEIINKTRLINVTPEQAIESVLPKESWDDIVEGTTTNGNTKFLTNEEKRNKAENLFAYAVTEGTNNKTKVLKRGLEVAALKELNQNAQNLTDAEKADLLPKMVEAKAREAFRNTTDPKIGAIINDKTVKFSTAKPKETPTIGQAFIAKDKTTDYNTAKENADSVLRDKSVLSFLTETAKASPTTLTIDKNGVMHNLNYDEAIAQATDATIKAKLEQAKEAHDTAVILKANNLLHQGGTVDVKLSGKKNTYRTLDGKKYEGTVEFVKQYLDDDSKRSTVVGISTPDEKGAVKTRLAKLDDKDNLAAFETDSKGTSAKFISEAGKKTDELLASQKKQNVSSQGKKEGVKEQHKVIEGKTIPVGGVAKYSKTTGKLIGYELNGEKYKF